ncbi:MAG: WYL domain-containing protein [Nitriliruptoraceae bacterium]
MTVSGPPKVERLVNLTIALLESRRPLTFADIKRKTGFYGQSDAESARRMFERDKDELRQLGVPIEIRDSLYGDEPGYVVSRARYELSDIDLTIEEVSALALAMRLAAAEGTRLAFAKLAARAPDPVGDHDVRLSVAVDVAPLEAIADAVIGRQTVSFDYRNADGVADLRRVDPYAVVQRGSNWYLVGHDHVRDDVRTFRFDRMLSQPRAVTSAEAFTRPDDVDVRAAIQGPEHPGEAILVASSPTARWALEARGAVAQPWPRNTHQAPEGWTACELQGFEPRRDVSWLVSLGPDVRVLAPPSVAEMVAEAASNILCRHTGECTGPSTESASNKDQS